MATLNSLFGKIIVYQHPSGKLVVRNKPDISKKVKTHASFRRTRENCAAFGKAAKAGKLIRGALHPWLETISDAKLSTRLAALLLNVIKAGIHADLMKPRLIDGDLSLLEGFDFNPGSLLREVFMPSF